MDETRQNQLSDINNILQVLQSLVNQSFLSSQKSEGQEEVHQEAENIFPVISCFAKVIHFVKEGSVNVPQVLLSQFLEVARILNIVNEHNVHHEDHEEDVGDEDLDDEEGDEVRDQLWWDDAVHQYQLYWGDEEDTDDGEVFASEHSEEDEEDFSVAHRVMARRRARLCATTTEEVRLPPPPSSPPATSLSPTPRRRTETKSDPIITAILRTIGRTAPKSVYSQHRAEILKKERSEERIRSIVPDELRTLWDTLDEEEDVKIIVPDPYPIIDWSKVNKRFIANIPEPTLCPIHSCSPDPAFYEWTERKVNGALEKIPPPFEKYDFYRKKGWFKAAEGMLVFGGMWGYETSEGIVSVSSLAHHGYVWKGKWTLHAEKPRDKEKIGKFQHQKKVGGKKKCHTDPALHAKLSSP